MLRDAKPAEPPMVGIVGEHAAAMAIVVAYGMRELEYRDGGGMPEPVRRYLAELRALAHEHAARCQAIAPTRDGEPERADGGRHERTR